MNDVDLISQLTKLATNGDESAIVELLLIHQENLESRIRFRVSKNPFIEYSVEDVLQETWIDVFKGISTFRTDAGVAFGTWLNRVADNRLSKILRDRGRLKRGGNQWKMDINDRNVVSLVNDLENDSASSNQRHLEMAEIKHAIALSVAALPKQQREVIERCYLKQQNVSDIAGDMHMTDAAVRGLLYRAKRKLRLLMGESTNWFDRKK